MHRNRNFSTTFLHWNIPHAAEIFDYTIALIAEVVNFGYYFE